MRAAKIILIPAVFAAALVAATSLAHAEGANPSSGTSQAPAGTDNSTAMPVKRDANVDTKGASAKSTHTAKAKSKASAGSTAASGSSQ
jgi:hypothetical protein